MTTDNEADYSRAFASSWRPWTGTGQSHHSKAERCHPVALCCSRSVASAAYIFCKEHELNSEKDIQKTFFEEEIIHDLLQQRRRRRPEGGMEKEKQKIPGKRLENVILGTIVKASTVVSDIRSTSHASGIFERPQAVDKESITLREEEDHKLEATFSSRR